MQDVEIEARGMTFQALVDGPANAPLVMMLHGLPRNRWEWHHQIPAVAAMGFRAVAPDLRGHVFIRGSLLSILSTASPQGQQQAQVGQAQRRRWQRDGATGARVVVSSRPRLML